MGRQPRQEGKSGAIISYPYNVLMPCITRRHYHYRGLAHPSMLQAREYHTCMPQAVLV